MGALLMVLCACSQGMTVPPVAVESAPPFPPGAVLAPLGFDHGSIMLRRGQPYATYRSGLSCIRGGTRLFWTVGGHGPLANQIEYGDLFHDQFSLAGYRVTGNPKELFPGRTRNAVRPAYRVAAQIEDIRANLCEEASILTGEAFNTQTGVAAVRVYWQVLSPITKDIVYEARTAGYHRVDQPVAQALSLLVTQAFAEAAANLAADPGMRELVLAPRPTAAALLRRKGGARLWLPHVPLYDTPLADHAAEVRHAVVTLDTGESHGSGFFIAPDLVITNHHVIDGHDVVRIVTTSGTETIGEVLRYDEARDVAVVRVEKTGHRPLPLRRRPVRISEPVFAVGTPKVRHLHGTVTAGVVSAVRSNRYGLPLIQADVEVHGGNSGGALLDASGNVIGLTASGYADADRTGMGLNMFVPIMDALARLDLDVRPVNDTRTSAAGGPAR